MSENIESTNPIDPDEPVESAAPGSTSDATETLPSRKRRRPSRSMLIVGSVALACFIAFGAALAVSIWLSEELTTANAASSALDDTVTKLETQLDTATDERDQYRDAADAVETLEAEVAEREKAVTLREEAVKATEEHIKATTLTDGYTYTVDSTMEPGVYQANSSSDTCYWKITVSGTNYSDIVENDLGSMGVITVTVGDGQDFTSKRCGDWVKVG